MGYEVIKRRGGRAYRYSVEYYRDESGKGRTRWTYCGPVEDELPPRRGRVAAAAERRIATRLGLLDALERLLNAREYAKVTADAIAREAGVAHGTFYRYFTDKADALHAAMGRFSDRIAEATAFNAPLGTLADEHLRVRTWVEAHLTGITRHDGVWRTWIFLSATDPHIAALRRTFRANALEEFSTYLQRLHAARYAHISDPMTFARLAMATIDGLTRTAAIDGIPLDDPSLAQTRDYVERAVFAAAERAA